MKDIIIIIGLPGSGKSYLIKERYKNNSDYAVFDDYKANAVLGVECFTYSRNYPRLISEMMWSKKNIIISDIKFCEHGRYKEAKDILEWWIKEKKLNYKIINIFFKNQPYRCRNNIKKNKQAREEKLEELSKCYEPENYIKDRSNDEIINVYNA